MDKAQNKKIKAKKLPGESRYAVEVGGIVYEVQRRTERTSYGDQPWDINEGNEWVQTFATKRECLEWLAGRSEVAFDAPEVAPYVNAYVSYEDLRWLVLAVKDGMCEIMRLGSRTKFGGMNRRGKRQMELETVVVKRVVDAKKLEVII